jgi:hypothetical protein
MADLKIKLKFGEFEFEIEGDKESVIQEFKSLRENEMATIIESIKSITLEKTNTDVESSETQPALEQKQNSNTSVKSPNKKSSSRKTTQKIPKQLMDLNLRPNGKTSLRDFFNLYEIKTNFERNVTYVYYLIKVVGIKNIAIDHIYTAYKETGQKVPENIYQSLIDTKKHRGWIDTTNIDDIKLSIQGENYIEHDAPKIQSKK